MIGCVCGIVLYGFASHNVAIEAVTVLDDLFQVNAWSGIIAVREIGFCIWQWLSSEIQDDEEHPLHCTKANGEGAFIQCDKVI